MTGPNSGWFNAINVSTGIFNWRVHLDLPANGGALVMNYAAPHPEGKASIIFTGLLDGRFVAYDGKSRKVLWQFDTGAVIWAPPTTFAANGKRYVLVASGGPGSMKVPELTKTIGPNVLTVFVSGKQDAPRSNGQKPRERRISGDDLIGSRLWPPALSPFLD